MRGLGKAIDGLVVDATHIYTLRIGVVLGRPGGFLGRLETPFRFGLGGPLGDGQQMLSWIHRDDLVAMIRWMLSGSPEAGAYNATSPQPVSNEDFTKIFRGHIETPDHVSRSGKAYAFGTGRIGRSTV